MVRPNRPATVEAVLEEVAGHGCRLVEVTGGEPLLQPDAIDLMRALLEAGYEVLLETGGSLPIDDVPAGVLRIVDVKCPGSGEAARNRWENLERLRLTGAVIVNREVAAALRDERARGSRFDLVLVDPPYGEWVGHAPALAEHLPALLASNALVVVETSERIEPELPLDLVTTRRYGSARMTVFSA